LFDLTGFFQLQEGETLSSQSGLIQAKTNGLSGKGFTVSQNVQIRLQPLSKILFFRFS
jgi:hypothetical protein